MLGRVAVLVAGLIGVAGSVCASPLITWDFSGNLTSTRRTFADVYPVGTPFTLRVTFDPSAPNLTESLYPGVPEGMYRAITTATLQLGNYAAVGPPGYVVVNCDWYAGCLSRPLGLGIVWFEMFGPWLGPSRLHPACPYCSIGRIGVDYFDPAAADGHVPTTPPANGARLEFAVVDPRDVFAVGRADVRSIQDVAAVPEPGSALLLATGLAALVTRRRRKKKT